MTAWLAGAWPVCHPSRLALARTHKQGAWPSRLSVSQQSVSALCALRCVPWHAQVNSLMLAGWAGLIFNALNCIPLGETDGGRIATALWGR